MSSTVPFHSKEKKGKSPVPTIKFSWDLPERHRMRDLSLASPSAPPRAREGQRMRDLSPSATPGGTKEPFVDPGPTLPKFKLDPENNKPGSYYTVSITKVDPKNIHSFYYPFTIKLASEENNIPSSSYTTTSMVDTKKVEPPPPRFGLCSKCGSEHSPGSYCPALPCKTCFDPQHTSAYCPYFDHIPKGAVFDRVNCEIICACGNMFDEKKWVCILCVGRPKLHSKFCVFCDSRHVQHSSHECPKDKVGAARLKAKMDEAFSRKKIPYTQWRQNFSL